jgi:hypothetical protein
MPQGDSRSEQSLWVGWGEERISATHPLRTVRKLVDAVLSEMSRDFVTTSRQSAIVGTWAESVMLAEKHNSLESSVICDIHA